MAIEAFSRIKPSARAPRPLPAPPSLAPLVQGKVVTSADMHKIDQALATWWKAFQTAFDSTVAQK